MVLAMFALSLAGTASADPSPKERKAIASIIRKAKNAKRAGDRFAKRRKTRAKASARYKVAAAGFLEAYRRSEEPGLLVLLANVYEARGENEWAQRLYERYVELSPSGAKTTEALRRASALAERDTAEDVEGDAEIDPSEFFGEEEAAPEPEEDVEEPVVEAEPVEPAPKPPVVSAAKQSDPGATLRYSGMGAAAVGLIAVGLGVKFGLDSGTLSDELTAKEGAWTLDDRQKISDGEQAETLAVVLTAVGAAGIVAGGVLYYMGSSKSSESQRSAKAQVVPSIREDGMTLSWVGSF